MRIGALITLTVLAVVTLTAAIGLGWPRNGADWFGAAGRLTGVAGLTSLLLATIISVRLPRLDLAFGGLSALWSLHHRLGLASFVLLLAHPPLMALAAWPYGPEALGAAMLPAAGDWALWSGWLALMAMLVFLAPSFQLLGRPEYQRWKALHLLAGVALVGGAVHALALTGAFSVFQARVVWGSLGGLALLVFLWRATLARRLMRQDYRITGRQELAERVVELSLEPVRGRMLSFLPGQFVYLTPLAPDLAAGHAEEHPYTISSAPGEQQLRIAIKDLGDASHALQTVAVPSHARVDGPYGDFLPERHRMAPQLWIGGGIGLTPFVSAARAMSEGLARGPVTLIYCAHDPSRAYFLDELLAIAENHDDFRVHTHYFQDHGPLTEQFIRQHCTDASKRRWYVCGPPPLVALVSRHARDLGIKGSCIHLEGFDFL